MLLDTAKDYQFGTKKAIKSVSHSGIPVKFCACENLEIFVESNSSGHVLDDQNPVQVRVLTPRQVLYENFCPKCVACF